jgi:hypothetical protein
MRTRLLSTAFLVLAIEGSLRAQSSAAISLQERVMMGSQIYHIISTFYPGLSQDKFDMAYQQYLAIILRTENRRDFDLASMMFVAGLHDGHSWFYDNWLDGTYGQPIGFLAYPLARKWTVVRSGLPSVHVGDVITAIDKTTIDDFFALNRRYVSASSNRDAGVSFFDTPAIFPEKFTITLDDGRKIPIDRQNDRKASAPPANTEGKWLVEKAVAYIPILRSRPFTASRRRRRPSNSSSSFRTPESSSSMFAATRVREHLELYSAP